MDLGLNKNEVKLVSYSDEWKVYFNQAKKDILKSLDISPAAIEHIGSTAIHGIMAKPIIDIVVGVEDITKLEKQFFKDLQQVGFLRLRVERPEEIVLARFRDDTYQAKTHFIHLVDIEGNLWKNLIFFRDYLNENASEREAYLQLKQDYIQHSNTGINDYTNQKEAFVRRIFGLRKDN